MAENSRRWNKGLSKGAFITINALIVSVILFLLGLFIALLLSKLLLSSISAEPGILTVIGVIILFYPLLGGISILVYGFKAALKLFLESMSSDYREDEPRIIVPISVIIPTYNGEETIGRVLRALLDQDYPRELMEIIVVDDGSTDNTWNIVMYYANKYKFIKALRHESNLGKAEALSTGIKAASGDIILLIDDDTFLERSALRRIASRLSLSPRLGAVSGRIEPSCMHGILCLFQKIEYFLSFNMGRYVDDKMNSGNLVLSGAFSAFKRLVIRPLVALGGFEGTLAEDFDLTVLVWRSELETGYENNAIAYTRVPLRLRDLYSQRLRWFIGGLQVLLKHSGIIRLWGRAEKPSERYGRRLASYLIFVEYLLPFLHIIGYLVLLLLAISYSLLGINVVALSLPSFIAIYAASYLASTVIGALIIILAYSAEKGLKAGLRLGPIALLYTFIYIPFLALAKTHSIIATFSRSSIPRWR